MRRDITLAELKKYKHTLRIKYRVIKIGIFGSLARDDTHEGSDVDVVVELEHPDLFALAGIKCDLEDILHTPIDVIAYSTTMNRFLKQRIDREALYV